MVRQWFFAIALAIVVLVALIGWFWPPIWWSVIVFGPLILLGLRDAFQTRHTVLRNFPVIGHGRYLIESVRPELQQYLIEGNLEAYPIEREFRALAYRRAKGELESQPFGTQRDVYRPGYEWAAHATVPTDPLTKEPRIPIGGPDCRQPYSSSLLNISAMSFGALSSHAVLALNEGARRGGFAHNTGEGGVSRYHLEPGGDLIWQIGSGYFGCRTEDGRFNAETFREKAAEDAIKMIEIKLSQGAKPGSGGLLPGVKVSPQIAAARGLQPGQDSISPPAHSAFRTPRELIEFIMHLRELSGGKPVGIKFCLGRVGDFMAMCKAMTEIGHAPDFITVDGGEGGTGAAPLEFSNSLGMPKRDALVIVHDILTGTGLRDRVRIVTSGKIISAFHMVRAMALGADACNSARGMMFALGCIQALRCNTNMCPTGITTQNPALIKGLVVDRKAPRVESFHARTIEGFLKIISAMGLNDPSELRPAHIFRRSSDLGVTSFDQLYTFLEPGQLLDGSATVSPFATAWQQARSDR
ncbi:MAG: glutamate synthase-related protein, partial [Xanthomonadales bacterium]|nr:glutamate synthase-related protein [Xanthomonadales bacterium]